MMSDLRQLRAAQDLEWLLSLGESSFEKSTMGSMLERAERTSIKHVMSEETKAAYAARLPHEPPPDLITAQPVKAPWYEPSFEPDERALLRFGDLSRRFRAVMKSNPQAARALGAAFGPVGARTARLRTEHGMLPALLPLVPTGIELLAAAREALGAGVTEPELLQALVAADAARERSTGKMARAMEEATELLREGLNAWQEAA